MDMAFDRPRMRLKHLQADRPKEGRVQRRSYPLKRHPTNDRVQWWIASPPSDTLSDDSNGDVARAGEGRPRRREELPDHRPAPGGVPQQRAKNGAAAVGGLPAPPQKSEKVVAEGHRTDPARHLADARSPAGRAGGQQRAVQGRPREPPARQEGGLRQQDPPKNGATKNGPVRKEGNRGAPFSRLLTAAGGRLPEDGRADRLAPTRGHDDACRCKCCQWQRRGRWGVECESSEENHGVWPLKGRLEEVANAELQYLTEDESEISSTVWTTLFQSQFGSGPSRMMGGDEGVSDTASETSSDRSTLKRASEEDSGEDETTVYDTDTDTDWDWDLNPDSEGRRAAEVPADGKPAGGDRGASSEKTKTTTTSEGAKRRPGEPQGRKAEEAKDRTGDTKMEFREVDTRPSWASMDSLLTKLCRQPPPERSQSWNDVSTSLGRGDVPRTADNGCGPALSTGAEMNARTWETTMAVEEEEATATANGPEDASSADESEDVSWVIQHLRQPEKKLGPRASHSMPVLAAAAAEASTPVNGWKQKRSDAPPAATVAWDSSESSGVSAAAGMMGRLYEGLVNKSVRKITSDFAVVVGERLFPVHKFVLHAHSGFFREMLQREEMQSSMHFKLDGVREDVFQNLHNFMYLGKLNVSHEDFPELLDVAKRLQMKDVPNVLLEFLEGSFDLTNAMALHEFSAEADFHPLLVKAHRLLASNFGRIVNDYYFLKVPVDKLLKILDDDCLVVQNEMEVYRAAQSWMLYDWKNRKERTEELMRTVRFALLTDEMLLACLSEMEQWNLLEIGHISKLMMDTLKYKMYRRLGHTYSSKGLNTKPRNGLRIAWTEEMASSEGGCMRWQLAVRDSPLILVIGGTEKSQAMHAYNPGKEEWQSAGLSPKPWSQAGIVELNGTVYVCGGHDLSQASATPGYFVSGQTWSCDASDGTWTQLAQMKMARVNHAALACKGKIYAIGGMDPSNRILNSVECYDPLTEQWTQKPNMPEGCVGMACSEFQGLLWICGGVMKSAQGPHNHGAITDLVQVYNPEKDKWYTSARLRIPRAFACLATVNNRLYLIGGKSPSQTPHQSHTPPRGISDVDLLDVTSNAWNHFTDLILPRHCCCAMAIGRHLYIVGGMSTATEEVLPFIERLDVVSRSLVRLSSELPVKVLGIGGVVLPANRTPPNKPQTARRQ